MRSTALRRSASFVAVFASYALFAGCAIEARTPPFDSPSAQSVIDEELEKQAVKNLADDPLVADAAAKVDYGERITVAGHSMNIYTAGEGTRTLVFFPGQGEVSAPLSYTNLIKALSPDFKLVIIEPFGYGKSDLTDAPRTLDNVTAEYHEAISAIGLGEYVIVAHSLGGIYALNYVNRYGATERIRGFVGLDTSTPVMEGGRRIPAPPTLVTQIPKIPDVEPQVNIDFRVLSAYVLNNDNLNDESERVFDDLAATRQMRFPPGFRGLHLLSTESDQSMEVRRQAFGIMHNWSEQHVDLHSLPGDAQVDILPGSHLIYHTQYSKIAEEIRTFTETLTWDDSAGNPV